MNCSFSSFFIPLASLLLTFSTTAVSAAEASQTPKSSLRRWAEQDYMLGNWGGLRADLSRHGVDFEFFYGASLPDNLSGGLHRGGLYQGGLFMALDVDSRKLLGYEGGTFHASSLWLHGQKPFSEHYIGDLNKVNLLDYPNAARLWELWYQQKILGGQLAFKFGQMSIDRDFIVPEYSSSIGQLTLLNQTFFFPTLPYNLFDIPGLPRHGHGLPSTPMAAPGVLARWNPAPAWHLQAAVYNGDPDQTYSGTRFNLGEQDGALAIFETGYHLNQATSQPGLGGSYKLGGFYHTGDFWDVYQGATGAFLAQAGFPGSPVRELHGNYGAYLMAEQQLFQETGKSDPAQQGLVGFARFLGAPSDRNLTRLEADAGLVYRGLIPSRDWDSLALAVSYLEMSDDIRHAQRDFNLWAPGALIESDYEMVIELSYKIQATAWWTIQPSLQRVFHPGGSAAIPNATAFILMSTLRF